MIFLKQLFPVKVGKKAHFDKFHLHFRKYLEVFIDEEHHKDNIFLQVSFKVDQKDITLSRGQSYSEWFASKRLDYNRFLSGKQEYGSIKVDEILISATTTEGEAYVTFDKYHRSGSSKWTRMNERFLEIIWNELQQFVYDCSKLKR